MCKMAMFGPDHNVCKTIATVRSWHVSSSYSGFNIEKKNQKQKATTKNAHVATCILCSSFYPQLALTSKICN